MGGLAEVLTYHSICTTKVVGRVDTALLTPATALRSSVASQAQAGQTTKAELPVRIAALRPSGAASVGLYG